MMMRCWTERVRRGMECGNVEFDILGVFSLAKSFVVVWLDCFSLLFGSLTRFACLDWSIVLLTLGLFSFLGSLACGSCRDV